MAFKRILCAVDFSEASLAALDQAADLAQKNRAKIKIFHSSEVQPSYSGWTLEDQLGEITLQIEEKAKQAMDSLVESRPLLRTLNLEMTTGTGRAFSAIVREAKEWRADLIVLGAVGRPDLDQSLVGSTAERVLGNAPCSVLVVRVAEKPA